MDPRLRQIVERIQRFQSNPGRDKAGELVDGSLLLQLELVRNKESYSEDDLFEALAMLGVPELEQASWFERYASWI
jgi:hypothetical protein